MNKYFILPFLGFLFIVGIFFHPFFLNGKLPIPSDTIVGLYHPYRDLYAKDYPNGIPYKNYLVTDPIRQQLPWRYLGIESLKKFEFPFWNNYSMTGVPLLGNFQSALLYPLNILFFFLSFEIAWSILVILQPLLAMTFMFLYLRNLRIDSIACFLGSIVYGFCGFSVAWLEWNTILHTAVWLPLILLSIDKAHEQFRYLDNSKLKTQNSKIQLKSKKYLLWLGVFIFSLSTSFFAGHLQTFFYLFIVSLAYVIIRWVQYGKSKDVILPFAISYLLFAVVTAVQWIPTLQQIQLSAREVDLDWKTAGWFIQWQHLVQFIAPDFFGNYSTLNYWGEWNYAEFIGYVGIFPLLCALFALYARRDKKTFFFGLLFFLAIIFSLPTLLAKMPYLLNIPFLSTSQPTRLLFIIDFSLAALAAFGMDYAIRQKKSLIVPLILIGVVFVCLWISTLFLSTFLNISQENILTAKRNLFFPSAIFALVAGGIVGMKLIQSLRMKQIMLILFITITLFDLFRFMSKFTPFSEKEYLYPDTKITSFLQNQSGQFRVMATNDEILPPNFSSMHHLQSIDGYDPLYLKEYGELLAAVERDKPDISTPFGFRRIITPNNPDSSFIDLLNVRYVLTFDQLTNPKFRQVLQEGKTRVFENTSVLPRAFMVENVKVVKEKQEAIDMLYAFRDDLGNTAVVERDTSLDLTSQTVKKSDVKIVTYEDNYIKIALATTNNGFLVLMDAYYPTWKAYATRDNGTVVPIAIVKTNYAFRGVFVPKATTQVEFLNLL